jgi:hypothetical protein
MLKPAKTTESVLSGRSTGGGIGSQEPTSGCGSPEFSATVRNNLRIDTFDHHLRLQLYGLKRDPQLDEGQATSVPLAVRKTG